MEKVTVYPGVSHQAARGKSQLSAAERNRLVRNAARLLTGHPPPDALTLPPDVLADLLLHHRLGAAAAERVRRSVAWQTALGASAVARLQATVVPAQARRRLVVDALADLFHLVDSSDVTLFKGLLLGELYPKPWLRNPGDIDLIAQPERFDTISDLLRSGAWEQQATVHWKRGQAVQKRFGFAEVWKHPHSPVTVDLHRDVVDRTEPVRPLTGDILARRVQTTLSEGISLYAPHPEDHLILAALHSVRHGFFRLDWLLDLYFACKVWRGALDSAHFRNRCRRWGVLRAVRVGLELSRLVFGGEWHPLESYPMDRWTRWALDRRTTAVIAHGHLVRRGGWRRIAAMADLMDAPGEVLAYLWRTALPPRELFAEGDNTVPWRDYLRGRIRAVKGFTG